MKVVWRPETEVVRKAVEKTKRLEKILEPSSDPSKMVLSEASRSIWLLRLGSNQRPNRYIFTLCFHISMDYIIILF